MKKIQILLLSLSLMILNSCGVVNDFCQHVYNNIPVDNNGTTYRNYSQQEAMDVILNTREAQAWNSSASSKGVFLASTGLKVVGELTGRDFSVATDIMDATTDDLISDKNTQKSTKHSVVGAAFYGVGNLVGYFEDKKHAENNDAFLAAHEEDIEKDKYFLCRWQIDETGEYVNMQKKYGMDTVMKCIRENQQVDYNQKLEDALAQCNPWVSISELDEMLIRQDGQSQEEYIDQKNKRYTIIRDALKCYELTQREEAGNEGIYYESNVDDIIEEERQITEYTQVDGADNEKQETVEINESANEVEALEQIKVDTYRFNSYALSDENKAELDRAAEILLRNPELEIELLGHSCDVGEKEAKYIIGIQRAKAAKAYLVAKGVDAKHIYVHSYADKRPLFPNNSVENRAKNRRVEIKIIK